MQRGVSLAKQSAGGSEEGICDLMGDSQVVHRLARHITQVAGTDFTVILQGETGTGKELVARCIHRQSPRANGAFVAVDCGAIPEELAESELFGYVKGAFTGAACKKAGYFEMAQGGTLFLDEITNLSPTIQMKLLRSIQERHIVPLGSEACIRTNVRLIVASNVVLEEAVRAGRFRADLFHRLNEFTMLLPPLHARREDILFLAERFRREAAAELRKESHGFTPEAQAYLLTYDWPGNVRELRNTVRRAVLLSSRVIDLKHLRQGLTPLPPTLRVAQDTLRQTLQHGQGLHEMVRAMAEQLEKTLIQQVLYETRGNKRLAAKRLQIGYKTLFRKLQAYNIQ